MDSLSTDVTLLTIGGHDKTACRVQDVRIRLPDGSSRPHGPLSWSFAQALINTPATSSWIRILAEMERLMADQGWLQPLLFHGQPTDHFGLPGGS